MVRFAFHALLASCLLASVAPPAQAGEVATLAVEQGGARQVFWRSDQAPARWSGADPVLERAIEWKSLAPGADWAQVRIACAAPVWHTELILARLDPRQVALTLDMDLARGSGRPQWSLDQAPRDAILAVNAGQFVGSMPWGWVVIDGHERLGRGQGPLSSAVAIDAAGRVRWTHGNAALDPTGVVAGFQSYPTLLSGDGIVPEALRHPGRGVSLGHRDARLALGQTRDGKLLVVMTRYDAVGELAGGIPLGPTTPEMAAILGALGASDAVSLDGGISAQLLLRDPAHPEPLRWPGVRRVPLALIARERTSAIP